MYVHVYYIVHVTVTYSLLHHYSTNWLLNNDLPYIIELTLCYIHS